MILVPVAEGGGLGEPGQETRAGPPYPAGTGCAGARALRFQIGFNNSASRTFQKTYISDSSKTHHMC